MKFNSGRYCTRFELAIAITVVAFLMFVVMTIANYEGDLSLANYAEENFPRLGYSVGRGISESMDIVNELRESEKDPKKSKRLKEVHERLQREFERLNEGKLVKDKIDYRADHPTPFPFFRSESSKTDLKKSLYERELKGGVRKRGNIDPYPFSL